MIKVYLLLGAIWVAMAFVSALIAKNKTIGFLGGFFISFFFTPLVGLILAFVSPVKNKL